MKHAAKPVKRKQLYALIEAVVAVKKKIRKIKKIGSGGVFSASGKNVDIMSNIIESAGFKRQMSPFYVKAKSREPRWREMEDAFEYVVVKLIHGRVTPEMRECIEMLQIANDYGIRKEDRKAGAKRNVVPQLKKLLAVLQNYQKNC